jgi:hypothetical protein
MVGPATASVPGNRRPDHKPGLAFLSAKTVAGVGAVKVERPQRSEDERP